MKKRLSAILTVAAVATMLLAAQSPLRAQVRDRAEAALKAAMDKETVQGDLKGAIELYKKAAQSSDRAVVAKALIQMAGCYQKLGDGESRRIYEQVVQHYADQKEAAAVARAKLGADAPVSGIVWRPIWSGPEVDTYGSVSSDGHYISFIAPGAGRGIPVDNVSPLALGLHDVRNGTNRQIVGPDEQADGSVISKDGKLMIFTGFDEKEKRYRLRLANLEGNANPRTLFDNPEVDWIGAYDWSADNQSAVVLIKRKDRTTQIGFVSVPEGSLRILKSVDWRGTGRIFLSPDGRYLGYDLPASDTNREHDVFVLSADGSQETVAVAHPSLNFMMGWSADSKWLLFAGNRTGTMSLWAVPFRDGRVEGTPQLIRPNVGPGEPMGVTQSGSLYYGMWSSTQSTSSIKVASLETGSGRALATAAIPKENAASDTQPEWSPDGKFLAYVSNRGLSGSSIEQSGQRMLVLVIRPSEAGGRVEELDLNLSGNVRLLHWTADGSAILFSGIDNKGRTGLFRVDARNGMMSTIGFVPLKPGEWDDGNWTVSADATTLYAAAKRCGACKDSTFYRRDIASGVETELQRGQLGNLNLSPNDEYIATSLADPVTNSRGFVLIPAKGGNTRDLMRISGSGNDLAFMGWAPDSQSVFIRELSNGKSVAVWRAPLNGTSPQKLDWPPDQIDAIGHIAIDARGTKVAYTPRVPARPPSSIEVWLLDNYLPLLHANK